jgi:hypothetical protein
MLKKCCGEWHVKLSARDGNFHVTCVCEGKNAQKVVLRFLSEQLYSVYAALKFCSTGRQGVFCCAVRVDKRMDKLFPLFQPIQIYIYMLPWWNCYVE